MRCRGGGELQGWGGVGGGGTEGRVRDGGVEMRWRGGGEMEGWK